MSSTEPTLNEVRCKLQGLKLGWDYRAYPWKLSLSNSIYFLSPPWVIKKPQGEGVALEQFGSTSSRKSVTEPSSE